MAKTDTPLWQPIEQSINFLQYAPLYYSMLAYILHGAAHPLPEAALDSILQHITLGKYVLKGFFSRMKILYV